MKGYSSFDISYKTELRLEFGLWNLLFGGFGFYVIKNLYLCIIDL